MPVYGDIDRRISTQRAVRQLVYTADGALHGLVDGVRRLLDAKVKDARAVLRRPVGDRPGDDVDVVRRLVNRHVDLSRGAVDPTMQRARRLLHRLLGDGGGEDPDVGERAVDCPYDGVLCVADAVVEACRLRDAVVDAALEATECLLHRRRHRSVLGAQAAVESATGDTPPNGFRRHSSPA